MHASDGLQPAAGTGLDRCPGCGAANLDTLLPPEERWIFVTDGAEMRVSVGLSSCSRCDLMMLNPRMSAETLHEYYRRQSRLPRAVIDRNSPFARLMELQLDFIGSHKCLPEDSRILEVGCAEGFFLERLRERLGAGVQLHGIEPSRRYTEFARARLENATIHETFLEETRLEPDSFDLIVIRHVLEHLDQPVASLSYLRPLMRNSGLLYIEVPDTAAVEPGVSQFFHHEHLTYFTRQTLESCLARAGLRALVIEEFRHNPAGSGFSYPVLRALATPDPQATPRDLPGEAALIWKRYVATQEEFSRTRLQPILARLKALVAEGARVGMFGAGPHTMDLLGRIGSEACPWRVIFDNNPNKAGKTMRGIPILQPTADSLSKVDAVLLSSAEFEVEMQAQVRALTAGRVETIPLYNDAALAR